MKILRIRDLREERNMPVGQLASAMGVSSSVISNWESELALPRTRELPHLAKVLGCTISDLFVESAS